jgi:hypothetical protein
MDAPKVYGGKSEDWCIGYLVKKFVYNPYILATP